MSIKKIMQTVQNMVDDNNQRLLIQHNGHFTQAISTVNPPAKEDFIAEFEIQIGYRLPKDYRFFLLEYNGAHIYQIILNSELNAGGGLKVYSVLEMKKNIHYMEVYPNFLPIGEVDEQYLAISLEAIQKKEANYLYLIDNMEGPQALNLDLHLFLDRFIVAQGVQFWEWPHFGANNLHYSED